MATAKHRSIEPKEPTSEEQTFLRKMFTYAYVAMHALPPQRPDQSFLELARIVLDNNADPGDLSRFHDHARARFQQSGDIVQLDDYRELRRARRHQDGEFPRQ